ncbi:MAG TPA: 4'-phosphopantetheinyl transferase superfamily protein [Abditibacterium sp.]|jgi:4'-phosphopantetheinyl transferase
MMQAGDVYLWLADLDVAHEQLPGLECHLSLLERAKARGFRFEHDARRFRTGRALLREILSSFVEEPASQLVIASHSGGKPFLPHHPAWHFNVSHCQNVAFFAVTQGGEIGVDIERVRRDVDIDALAPRLFCAQEQRLLQENEEDAYALFWEIWTLKEAYLKGTGQGLSVPLPELDVASGPGRILSRNAQTGIWSCCDHWVLRSFLLPSNHRVSVARATERDNSMVRICHEAA